jgi:NAD(P)-dependent dehydrogenase (short-subunit alcohol dehydrogenase family)
MSSPIVILTGASRGLGLATLRILLERYNARVTAVSRSCPTELEEVQRAHADRVELIKGDVGSIELNKEVVQRTVDRWGGIDGLIINAGSLEPVGASSLLRNST